MIRPNWLVWCRKIDTSAVFNFYECVQCLERTFLLFKSVNIVWFLSDLLCVQVRSQGYRILTPSELTITKTCLYNFDPLKPHFYIVKLGFTGVYIIFFLFLLNRGDSNENPQSMF